VDIKLDLKLRALLERELAHVLNHVERLNSRREPHLAHGGHDNKVTHQRLRDPVILPLDNVHPGGEHGKEELPDLLQHVELGE